MTIIGDFYKAKEHAIEQEQAIFHKSNGEYANAINNAKTSAIVLGLSAPTAIAGFASDMPIVGVAGTCVALAAGAANAIYKELRWAYEKAHQSTIDNIKHAHAGSSPTIIQSLGIRTDLGAPATNVTKQETHAFAFFNELGATAQNDVNGFINARNEYSKKHNTDEINWYKVGIMLHNPNFFKTLVAADGYDEVKMDQAIRHAVSQRDQIVLHEDKTLNALIKTEQKMRDQAQPQSFIVSVKNLADKFLHGNDDNDYKKNRILAAGLR